MRHYQALVYIAPGWRRHGLGQALAALRERGTTSAQLGVDTENPNDALTLYREHRFESFQTETEWHKPLELDDD